MPKQNHVDQTLPSVVAAPGQGGLNQVLLTLTIIFHPDTSRIGEAADIEKPSGECSRIIGREAPCFKRLEKLAPLAPLNDLYVSKEALRLRYTNGSVVLDRDSFSSRAQVDGSELKGEVKLVGAQLDAGVPILLGGRIVLLLRRTTQYSPFAGHIQSGEAMRGSSAYMAKLKEQISLLARSKLDVLIRGETGTGKELVAEALHAASDRAGEKMIAVNMAAIPAALAPTLLFGSARGAFTGADKASIGYFEQAAGSTLFLDEIGDTPTEVQAQLLRALQQREIQTVGGPVKRVNLRVISATDADLDNQSCTFKAALRHRLAESEILLQPLRHHPEDIGVLLLSFLEVNMASLGRDHVLPDEDSRANEVAMWAELFHQFVAYSWPGNIRELSNFSQQVAMASETTVVIPDSLAVRLAGSRVAPLVENVSKPVVRVPKSEDYSDQEFLACYESADYEVLRTARQLGISRQAVYRRIFDFPDLCLASELSDDQIRVAMQNYGEDLTVTAMQLRVSRTALRERIRNVSAQSLG